MGKQSLRKSDHKQFRVLRIKIIIFMYEPLQLTKHFVLCANANTSKERINLDY